MIERIGGARPLAVAAAAALIAACGNLTVSPSARPPQTVGTAPAPASSSRPPGAPPTGTPDQVAAVVAAQVPSDRPRLLPRWFPAPMVARATVTADGYQVTYADDLHTKEITFAAGMGLNPPLPAEDATSGFRQFRGVRASYVVYQPSVPTSQRYLQWLEPGTWPRGPNGLQSNDMFLEATGLTEAEFLRVADSVAPVG